MIVSTGLNGLPLNCLIVSHTCLLLVQWLSVDMNSFHLFSRVVFSMCLVCSLCRLYAIKSACVLYHLYLVYALCLSLTACVHSSVHQGNVFLVCSLIVVLGIVFVLTCWSAFTNLSLFLFIESVSSKCIFRCLACCLKCSQFAFDSFHRGACFGLLCLYLVLSVVTMGKWSLCIS